jgi:CheY-like chemotaxis protein
LDAAAPCKLTILIVEDEWIVRLAIAALLQEAGYTVLEAETGEQALALLAENRPIDIVFTDIVLGGRLNGWDVAEAFRVRYSELPIIYTSGYMTMPPRIVDGGIFFPKPYSPDQIIRACGRVTEHKFVERETQ